MKKFFFAIVSLILSLNFALASDLLFKATNGVLNENSLGVKKLDDEEMKRVAGAWFGFQRASQYDFRGGLNSQAYIVYNQSLGMNTQSYLSASQKLNVVSDVFILAKVRWFNGRKNYYMQGYNPQTQTLSNLWVYGTLKPVFQAFTRRY